MTTLLKSVGTLITMEDREDAKDSDTGDTTAIPETAAAALTRAELHEAAIPTRQQTMKELGTTT